jgi:hypothetical protein
MPDTYVEVRALNTQSTGGGRMLNCTFTLESSALLRELVYIDLAVDIEEGDIVKRENGILIKYTTVGETFWSVGKEFGVTPGQLQGWNPEINEPFDDGRPIMILSAKATAH